MNPARYEGNKKIATIVNNEITRWEQMSKDALIRELIEEKVHFLETELEYGNEEYLDELIEEIEEPVINKEFFNRITNNLLGENNA